MYKGDDNNLMKQKLINNFDNNKKDSTSSRTPFDEACEIIMKILAENQKIYSITSLAKEVRLHRNTVEKCIDLLIKLEKNGLEDYRLKLENVDNKKIIMIQRRTGLLSFPEDIQRLIIKARHFPLPSTEGYVLLYMYLRNATTLKNAVKIESIKIASDKDDTINKLIKQGQINKSRKGLIFLSDEGITIAKGTLQLFPELEQQK
jgi:DNA-binding transcriptional regulator YhcF (GntR family)